MSPIKTFLLLGAMAGCGTPSQAQSSDGGVFDSNVGSDAAVIRPCTGIEAITLAIAFISPAGRAEPGRAVVSENGRPFLYLNGFCNYWVDGELAGEARVRHLSPNAEARLVDDLRIPEWREFYGRWYGEGADAPTIILWDGNGLVECAGLCMGSLVPPKLELLVGEIREELEGLREHGIPLMGRLRVVAVEVPEDQLPAHIPPFEWTLQPELSSIATTELEAGGFVGVGVLLDEPDTITTLRAAWKAHIAESRGYGFLPTRDAQGRAYRVYVRDSLPFEGSNGLVSVEQ